MTPSVPAARGATAILLATAPSADGAPAAALPWHGTTLGGRLCGQLAALGAADVHVITRPEWAREIGALSGRAEVHVSPGTAGDVRALAAIAGQRHGAVVIANADILTQREALAGLLADPRVESGILVSRWQADPRAAVGAEVRMGQVVGVGTELDPLATPTDRHLGIVKVGRAHREALVAAATHLADALDGGLEPAPARADLTARLLRGLVDARVPLGVSRLRGLFWSRPLSPAEIDDAATRIAGHDEEAALLAAAVKPSDGFFTTFFVSPYSRYLARWAARRGVTPNAVTGVSMALGLLAALAFAAGGRGGLIAGAVLLQAAFTLDCVDGQLARYSRTFTAFGAWLDAICDRAKECAVYAGLAAGAATAGDDLWLLAAGTWVLQTVRHMADAGFDAARTEAIQARLRLPAELRGADTPPSSPEQDGAGPVHWARKILLFPIGERFAAISVAAACFDARTTFLVLLGWGGVSMLYTCAVRLVRGPLRWTIPPLLATLELGGVLWLAAIGPAEARPAAFALLAAIALRRYDALYRGHAAATGRARRLLGGWTGRLLLACALAAAGVSQIGFAVMAAVIGGMLVAQAAAHWRRAAADA